MSDTYTSASALYDREFARLLATVRQSENARAILGNVARTFSDVPSSVIPVGDPRAAKLADAVKEYRAAIAEVRRLEHVMINLCDETLHASEGGLL